MKMGRGIGLLFGLFLIGMITTSCLEPFNPDVPAKDIDILVVEGYINADTGITRIRLSRVAPLKAETQLLHENNAQVWIENDASETFQLTARSAGRYETDTLILPVDQQYRIVIKLQDGTMYTSEPQTVKITPPIDSIYWEWKDQLYVYATSHDDQSQTHYYTWTFVEDWQIRSRYRAEITYVGGQIMPIDPNVALKLLDCWGKAVSNEIIFASTVTSTQDAVRGLLTTVPAASDKTQTRYIITAQQRTMTEDEYNYLVLVKKNSEISGSFFDPMPSQLFGNIHRVDDPKEVVVGYIGAYTTEWHRYFLDVSKLPPYPQQEKCPPLNFENSPGNLAAYLSNPQVVLPYKLDGSEVIALPAICLDCRLKPNAGNPRPDYEFPD